MKSGAASHAAAFKDDTAERLNELVENTMEKMSGFVEGTAEKMGGLVENTAEKVARTAERLSELTEDAAARVSGTLAQRAEGSRIERINWPPCPSALYPLPKNAICFPPIWTSTEEAY